MVCSYCQHPADEASMDSKVKCNGPCEQFIHIGCVNLTKAALKAFNECDEMHFYCNLCKKFSLMGISETMTRFTEKINDLSVALKPLEKVDFNALTSRFSTNTIHPNITIRPKKRARVEEDQTDQSDQNVIKSSELVGTNQSKSLDVVPRPRSIVVSRLANVTTIDTIVKYIVDNSPGTLPEELNCTVLLPNNMKAEDLKHINFRVTVPDKIFERVFNPSFWPTGIRLREYVYRPRIQQRPQARQQQQQSPVFLGQQANQ